MIHGRCLWDVHLEVTENLVTFVLLTNGKVQQPMKIQTATLVLPKQLQQFEQQYQKINVCYVQTTTSIPIPTVPALSISLTTRKNGVALAHGAQNARTSVLVVPRLPALDTENVMMESKAKEPARVRPNTTNLTATNHATAVMANVTMGLTEMGHAHVNRITMD